MEDTYTCAHGRDEVITCLYCGAPAHIIGR